QDRGPRDRRTLHTVEERASSGKIPGKDQLGLGATDNTDGPVSYDARKKFRSEAVESFLNELLIRGRMKRIGDQAFYFPAIVAAYTPKDPIRTVDSGRIHFLGNAGAISGCIENCEGTLPERADRERHE